MSQDGYSLSALVRDEAFLSRFYAKVDDSGDCWEWRAARDDGGYGRFGVIGKCTRLAHHVAYCIATGTDPAGRVVMHSCDNPPCVNAAHLKLGTHGENSADKVAKHRHAGATFGGAAHPRARFTDEQVDEVRRMLDAGESQAAVARHFGVSAWLIYTIKHNLRKPTGRIDWKAEL